MPFLFFSLPQDLIDYVLAEVVGSLTDYMRMDVATCESFAYPLFLKSMHQCHIPQITLTHDEPPDSREVMMTSLHWILLRQVSITWVAVCPCTVASFIKSPMVEGRQIEVKRIRIITSTLCSCTKRSITIEDVQALASWFRWSELEWDDYGSSDCEFMKWFCGVESQQPLLSIEQLTRINEYGWSSMNPLVGSSLLHAPLKDICVRCTNETLHQWVKVIIHCNTSLESLKLTFDNCCSSIGVGSGLDSSCVWPALSRIELESVNDGFGKSDRDEFTVAVFRGAVNLRYLKVDIGSWSHSVAIALLTYLLWRPRKHVLDIYYDSLSLMISDNVPLSGLLTNNPPITTWNSVGDLMESSMWQFVPKIQQRFRSFGRNDPGIEHVPAICFELVSDVVRSSTAVVSDEQWRFMLSSSRLRELEDKSGYPRWLLDGTMDSIAFNIRHLTIDMNKTKPKLIQQVLDKLPTYFGRSLQSLTVRNVFVSLDAVVQIVWQCLRLTYISVLLIGDDQSDVSLHLADDVMQPILASLPRSERRLTMWLRISCLENGRIHQLYNGGKLEGMLRDRVCVGLNFVPKSISVLLGGIMSK